MKRYSKILMIWFAFLPVTFVCANAAEFPEANSQSQSGNKIEYLDESGAMTKIVVIHDEKRSVTCWVIQEFRNKSISCLPDKEVNLKAR